MEKMKRRSAWMRIMAVMLALVMGITMMPLDTFAAAGKDSGAYLTGSEAADDELMLNAACDHVHDDCDCDDCAHDDCDCEDHCGESHSCSCDNYEDIGLDGSPEGGVSFSLDYYELGYTSNPMKISVVIYGDNSYSGSVTYSDITAAAYVSKGTSFNMANSVSLDNVQITRGEGNRISIYALMNVYNMEELGISRSDSFVVRAFQKWDGGETYVDCPFQANSLWNSQKNGESGPPNYYYEGLSTVPAVLQPYIPEAFSGVTHTVEQRDNGWYVIFNGSYNGAYNNELYEIGWHGYNYVNACWGDVRVFSYNSNDMYEVGKSWTVRGVGDVYEYTGISASYSYEHSEAENFSIEVGPYTTGSTWSFVAMPLQQAAFTINQYQENAKRYSVTYNRNALDAFTISFGGSCTHTWELSPVLSTTSKDVYRCTQCGATRDEENTTVTPPAAATNLVYNGETQTGVPAGTGYTITGNTGKDAGDYTATAALADGYTWTDGSTDAREIAWSIAPATLTAVTLTATDFTYNGNVQKPTVTKVLAGELSAPFTDFTLKWSNENSKTIGSYTVTATGKNNFTGTATAAYTISAESKEVDLKDAKIVGGVKKEDGTDDDDYEYTRKEIEKIGLEGPDGKPLVKGKEYEWTVTEKEDNGPKWEIVSKPVKGKTKGDDLITIKKRSTKKHNVTVHYTLPSPGNGVRGQSVAPTVVKSYYEGETYSIAAPKVAVPGKAGKYYRQSNYYVTGMMGTTDQEHTVIYEYSEQVAVVPFEVDVYYKVEAREGDNPEKPKDVKIRPLQNGDPYSITSPEVRGYYPDIKVVEGKIEGKNVVATVTYKPQYWASCSYKFPDGKGHFHTYKLCDGGYYHFPVKPVEVFEFIHDYGSDRGMANDISRAWQVQFAIENNLDAVWTPNPAETISGHIQGKDESFTVEYTCSHPGRYYEQIEFSSTEKQNGTHVGLCSLCNAEVEPEEACVFKRVGYVRSDDMNSPYDKKFPAGAILYKCTKCDNFYYVESKDDICPASSKDDPQPHLWSHWNKVSDTQCERTCARCKETITTGHVWGEWEYTTSKVHSRRCSLCHCTQTGDHGAWSNVSVHKQATCIADAEVGATCGICNKQINNVYYGIVGSIDPKHVRTGHDFSGGGYARIHGGHVQKCKICGAFDMEHHESHAWSDWSVTEGGDSCTGTRKMRRECVCGAYETKTEENSHNYVRDPARETAVTCESAGKECYTCSKCGDHNDKDVAALGHAWVEDEGNYPAKCGQEGRMWWHCANPGCSATKKDDCPAPSDHEWVPNWISKASCTREGVKNGEICSHCGEHRNEGDLEYVDRLNHDLETTKTLKRSGTYVSKTGNAAFDQEVWVVTNRCKTCGYNFPEAVYTVAKSGNLSRYKIEPGDVKITDMGDGIHVSGQFGKANAVYFNNTVNGAFKEVVDNLLNIYRQKEGSVITEFTPEFMNSLKDGEYEMIHVNGDELSAATLTVKDHKFVTPEGAQDGKLPGIKSLDESGVIGATVDPDLSEKIEVGGQEVDYYPWMADGEMLFYLGQIEDNPTSVDAPDMGEGYTAQTAHADPCVTPETADFDRKEGSRDNADVVVVKSDKGHTFDSAHPISLFGENVPETEEVESEDGEEKVTRTNYVIAGDKITFKKDYLESLGEGEHTFLINYTGGAQPGQVTVNIKGIPASGSEEDDEPETGFWNLFDNANEHKYTVSGVSTATEAANNNKNSSKYFNATLKDNEITVSLKDGADRKKAAASNAFDFDLGDAGTVSYTLPLTYNKPVLKLSSAKGTVKKGKSTVLSTRVYAETENGNYVPFDLEGATVTYGTNTVTTGKNGIVKITADGKTSGKIRIMRWGWNEKDPVELGYSIAEVKPEKDVVTVDLGGVKQVVLNSNAPEQAFEFPVYLNGEPATADTVVLTANKAEAAALGSIGEGVLNVSIGRSGLTKGSYTLTVASKNDTKAKVNVKVKISDKALSAAATGKIKQKLDVVTNVPMLVEPTLKEVSGKIMDVSVSVTDEAAVYKDFRATLSGGNISVRYVGKTPLDAKKLKFGNMKFSLTVDGITDPVEFIIKNVSAKKTTPAVKASKVVIPKSAAEKATGETVIATANILSTYKDTAKHVRTIKPEKVNLVCKNVTATVDPGNNTRVLIKKLDGSSGSVKATLTYAGGVTKTVTISVKRSK